MHKDLTTRKKKLLLKKKKLIADFFNFFGVALTLFMINYMVGGYWWSMWPIGFYALALMLSFLGYIKDEITYSIEEEEEEYTKIDESEPTQETFSSDKSNPTNNEFEDVLELENIPKRKSKVETKKWDDRDMV